MKKNVVKDRSFEFALIIVSAYKVLSKSKNEYVLSRQLLRSGTAVGALIREAEHAESKADFIHKMSIALKEANECEYWLELLYKSGYLNDLEFDKLRALNVEILKLLITIIKSAKSTMRK